MLWQAHLSEAERRCPRLPESRHLPEIVASRRQLRASLVCYWHKADMLNALTNVRFWGQSGH